MAEDLERARTLLERAGHPNTPEEEARTAAVLAARIAYRLGLVLTTRDDTAEEHEHHPSRANPGDVWPGFVDKVARAAGVVEDVFTAAAAGEAVFKDIPATVYQHTVARRDGRCVACQGRITVGDKLAFVPRKGSTHWRCREFWDATDPIADDARARRTP